MLGGDPAVCSHRVEQFPALRGLEGSCWAEIHQLALIGLSRSLRSEACNALGASDEVTQSTGGDPAACSHGVEKLIALWVSISL